MPIKLTNLASSDTCPLAGIIYWVNQSNLILPKYLEYKDIKEHFAAGQGHSQNWEIVKYLGVLFFKGDP